MQRYILRCFTLTGVALSTGCGESGPSNAPPLAQMHSACAALRCEFKDMSTDDVVVTSWSWTLGDGDSATDQHLVHTFATPDTYSVSLTVTDGEGLWSTATQAVVARAPVVAPLTCADASAPGGFVRCKLNLEHEAGFRVVLTEKCAARGNTFRLILPVLDTLTTDGCYEPSPKERTYPGPFAAGTDIDAEIIAPLLASPPQVVVTDSYPVWTLKYEDGADLDFNDLVVTITALPTGN
jgi:PKD repeat protein